MIDNNGFSRVVTLNSPDGVLPQWFSLFVNKSLASNIFSAIFSYLVICVRTYMIHLLGTYVIILCNWLIL